MKKVIFSISALFLFVSCAAQGIIYTNGKPTLVAPHITRKAEWAWDIANKKVWIYDRDSLDWIEKDFVNAAPVTDKNLGADDLTQTDPIRTYNVAGNYLLFDSTGLLLIQTPDGQVLLQTEAGGVTKLAGNDTANYLIFNFAGNADILTNEFRIINADTTEGAIVKLLDYSRSSYVGWKSPDTLNESYLLVLPDTLGTTNTFLYHKGGGVLGWRAVPTTYVFSSGLTESPSGTVKLGGVLTQPTAIVASNTNFFTVTDTSTLSGISVAPSTVQLWSESINGDSTVSAGFSGGKFELLAEDTYEVNNQVKLEVSPQVFRMTDNRLFTKGIEYANVDYTELVDSSLVTKGFSDTYYGWVINDTLYDSNFTAISGQLNQVDVTGGAVEVTVPTVQVGDKFFVVDALYSAGTNDITIKFSTSIYNIYGISQDYIIQNDGGLAGFLYVGGAVGFISLFK